MTPEEIDAVHRKVTEEGRLEWIALTPAREKMEKTVAAATKEYERAVKEYRRSVGR